MKAVSTVFENGISTIEAIFYKTGNPGEKAADAYIFIALKEKAKTTLSILTNTLLLNLLHLLLLLFLLLRLLFLFFLL